MNEKLFDINLQLFADGPIAGDEPPAPDDGSQGAEGEPADPPANEPQGGDNPPVNNTKNVNTPAQDRAFAEMRRNIEKANKLIEKLYGDEFGIKTIDELEAKVQEMERNQQMQQYQQMGLDPNLINDLIAQHPDVQAARQLREDQRLLNEFKAVKDEFGDLVKSPDDIPVEAWEKYEKGYSLLDAYMSVNRKQILEHMQKATKQQTLNNLNSKQHLGAELGNGGQSNDVVNIPQETLQMYLEQGMSKKEAIAHYKKLYS